MFDGFYREHFVTAWRALHRLGVDASDCDDAAQETFVAAHRHWHACDDEVPRRAWLLAIARKIAWRYRRTDERRARRIAALAQVEPVVPALDEMLLRREAARLLAEFLERLDHDKREAFVLGELEELGRRELGHALGVNPNTAYSRLQAARREFFAHFAALHDHGCATLLACVDMAETPDEAQRDRAWSTLAILLWPRRVALPITLGLATLTLITAAIAPRSGDGVPPRTNIEESPVFVPAGISSEPAAAVRPATPPQAVALPAIEPIVDARPRIHPRASTKPSVAAMPLPSPNPDELGLLLAARTAMVSGDLATARRKLDDHVVHFGIGSPLARLRVAIARDLEAAMIRSSASGDPMSTRSPP